MKQYVARKKTLGVSVCIMMFMFAGVALSAGSIQMVVNGEPISTGVAPQIIDGVTLVPIRAVAEALGAEVEWNQAELSVVITNQRLDSLEQQLRGLQEALKPKTAKEAVEVWIEAIQNRNGAVQFALYSPEQQELVKDKYEELNWVSGGSSPWVESYTISEGIQVNEAEWDFTVTYILKTSGDDGELNSTKVKVKEENGQWFIHSLAGDGEGYLYFFEN